MERERVWSRFSQCRRGSTAGFKRTWRARHGSGGLRQISQKRPGAGPGWKVLDRARAGQWPALLPKRAGDRYLCGSELTRLAWRPNAVEIFLGPKKDLLATNCGSGER